MFGRHMETARNEGVVMAVEVLYMRMESAPLAAATTTLYIRRTLLCHHNLCGSRGSAGIDSRGNREKDKEEYRISEKNYRKYKQEEGDCVVE
ncbi:hypothetical protein E2C01_064683 [Portunus trituberculatus]|uniref:Uncharacterized protein n=1 Tax=Portunus trituberculatus TaxID=210409 RepID=A0A5B7HJS9_PORTR|nr:hypothetical protein [Portunus trituberculatus]